jgi:hypothetical protein
MRKQSGNDGDFSVPTSKLKVQSQAKLALSTAGSAILRTSFGEFVDDVEELLVRGLFLATLRAIKILSRHG